MSRAYICTVANDAQENYRIGVIAGRWGVQKHFSNRIERVRPGDRIVFVVGGAFRSIHRVLSEPYEDHTRPGLWPERDGGIYPHRVVIGPAEFTGSVPVTALMPSISFLRQFSKLGRSFMGANGVFNDRLTDLDVAVIEQALESSSTRDKAAPAEAELHRELIELPPVPWLPELLEQLAGLSKLQRMSTLPDPFQNAEEWRQGLFTGVYADPGKVPTIAVMPVDRAPTDTVLSTLYGLSSLKQIVEPKLKEVRGLIYVRDKGPAYDNLLQGLPNVGTVGFDIQVRLRS